MTTLGLEIELEQSGSQLILCVSRYKFGGEIREAIARFEQRHLKAVDEALNDDLRLSWTDIGGGSRVVSVAESLASVEKAAAIQEEDPFRTESPGRSVTNQSDNASSPIADSPTATAKENEVDDESVTVSEATTSPQPKENSSQPLLSSPESANETASLSKDDDGHTKTPPSSPESIEEEPAPEVAPSPDNDTQDSDTDDELPRLSDNSSLRFELVENDHSVAPSSSPDSALLGLMGNGTGVDADDDDDDQNAWCHCVCGIKHSLRVPVFWIQCEVCMTWYNAAEECVGFSEAQAEDVKDWNCWGCPPIAKINSPSLVTQEQREFPSPSVSPASIGTRVQHSVPQKQGRSNSAAPQQLEAESDGEESKSGSIASEPFKVKELVFIKEHG